MHLYRTGIELTTSEFTGWIYRSASTKTTRSPMLPVQNWRAPTTMLLLFDLLGRIILSPGHHFLLLHIYSSIYNFCWNIQESKTWITMGNVSFHSYMYQCITFIDGDAKVTSRTDLALSSNYLSTLLYHQTINCTRTSGQSTCK